MDTPVPPTDPADSQIKRLDIDLKKIDLEIKQNELKKKNGFLGSLNITAIEATIIVGFLGFLGSFAATYLQQREQLIVKANEFTSQLILSAMKDADANTALTRLKFLIEAGYLRDEDNRIANLILSGKYGSAITIPSSPKLIDAIVHGNAPTIIGEIIAITGQVPDVNLKVEENFSGIAAISFDKGHYMLHYDRKIVQGLASDKHNNWVAVAILAHEIGHAVRGHMLSAGDINCLKPAPVTGERPCGKGPVFELEADRYAGFVLRRLGASLDEAKATYAFLPEEGGPTHPGRADRVDMLAKGWADSECPCSVSGSGR